MNDEMAMIALRIKDLREIKGMSPEAAASALNVPLDVYKKYESGNHDISMGFLMDFAKHFKVEMTDLLTGTSPKLHKYTFIKKGKGISVERRKFYQYQNLAYNFANKKAEPFLVTVEPRDEDFNLNTHEGQEFNYCTEGRLMIQIDGQEVILEPGDSLYFDSMAPHGMKALDGKPAQFLAVILQ